VAEPRQHPASVRDQQMGATLSGNGGMRGGAPSAHAMRLTRRRLLAGATTALGAAGLYEAVDRLTTTPPRPAVASERPVEQHVLDGQAIVLDDGVEVLVPPLHHRVVTARVAVGGGRTSVREAREALESELARLDAEHPASPAGLAVTVAWGLPYFRRYVSRQAERLLPVDRRATGARGETIRVLEDAERFPSDPEATILEENDVAVLLRSDHLDVLDHAHSRLFDDLLGVFDVTSVRKGFVGGGFGVGPSLPKRMAMAAALPGADLIPEAAELFLGFTSTQRHALGPGRIANLETLGYAELRGAYFVGATHMHLSHLHENVDAWYRNFDRRERLAATFRPGLRVSPGRRTVRQAPEDVQSIQELRRAHERHGRIGHAGALQSASRLDRDVVGSDGVVYRKGTPVPQRADFNTLDNPFAWTSAPARDGFAEAPVAGLHFVAFNPTSDDFRRVRLAMDGVLPDGTRLQLDQRSRGQGLNAVLRTTHRQNFLVPSRAHRSFPLSELS
jgi:hypothetical protein